ncbi:hypothetical protein BJ165DRAFT_1528926 [Panaeolus papilionaceus]|nr:hypothetical protein BJ165DRAFT_1528926 [Panaeolus papilionaceus]
MATQSVEDNDHRIAYLGQWKRIRIASASGGTVTSTDEPRSSLTFSFTGTQISVFCAVDSSGKDSNNGVIFSVDDNTPQKVSNSVSSPSQNRPCWSSQTLSPANHVLSIRTVGDTKFFIDRIDFVQVRSDPVPPPSDPVPSPGALPPTFTSSVDIPQPNDPNPTVTVTLNSNPSSNQQATSSPDPAASFSSPLNALPTLTFTSANGLPSSQLSTANNLADPSFTTDYGGVFSSLLAGGTTETTLGATPTPSNAVAASSTSSAEHSKAKIVGGVLGTLLGLLLFGIITYFVLKRREKRKLLDSEIHSPYTDYRNSDYDNLPSPSTRVRDSAQAVTPYTLPPSQTQYYSANQLRPASHQLHPEHQHSRPASFSSSMYTDGPALRVP